jgi:short-subunit dehydrogenase
VEVGQVSRRGAQAETMAKTVLITKWAVEGFSEGLQYELRPFNVRVRAIEPGLIETDF